jgi:hypothetical protein
MKKTRILGRVIAGVVTSAVLLGGTFAAPAQGDTGWSQLRSGLVQTNDTGWGKVK